MINWVELTESLIASLGVIGGEGYSIDATDTATLTIVDNDTATFTIDDLIVNESVGTAQFTVRPDQAVDREIHVAIQLTNAASDARLPEFAMVTFAAGSTEPQQVIVTIIDDQLGEAAESFTASLSVIGGEGYSIDATDTATLTILDNDTATFTIEDLTVNESDGTTQFTIQLDREFDREIQLAIQLTDAASDTRLPEFAFVTFAAGSTEPQQVLVTIFDDELVEQTELFVASLSVIGGEGYSIDATDMATLTIEDNDTATFTIDDLIVNESDGTAQFIVRLDHAIDREIQIAIQLADAASDTRLPEFAFVTFAAGSTEPQQVLVTIVDDELVEQSESFVASLSVIDAEVYSIDATDTATLTIEDNDTATFTINDLIVNESDGTVQFTVQLDHAIDREIQIAIQLTDAASDASLPEFAFVAFAAGSTESQQVLIRIVDDELVELAESFIASLNVIGGEGFSIDATDMATLTIEDNDTATFTIDDLIVNESDGTAQFIVRLDHAIDREIQVAVQLTDAASDASLPEFAMVTFAAGSTEPQQVSVTIFDDELVEQAESFLASLSVIGGEGYAIDATDMATLTIEDNDTATFTIDDLIVNESDGTVQFTVQLDHAIDREIQVAIQLADAASDASLPEFAMVTFTAGSTEPQQVSVTIFDDELVEQTESFVASLSVIDGEGYSIDASDTAALTIEDNDTATFTIDDLIVNESDGTAQFIVRLDHAIDREIQVAIQLTDAASDASLPEFGFVTFAAGSTEPQQVSVTIFDDDLVEQTELFVASLSVIDGEGYSIDASDTAALTIEDNDTATFTIDDLIVNESDGTAQFIVRLGHAIDREIQVAIQLTRAASDASLPEFGFVTFAAGSTESQQVVVTIVDDQLVERTESFVASLSVIGSEGYSIDASDTAALTIEDNDTATFTIDDLIVNESDGTAQFIVRLDHAIDREIQVAIQLTDAASDASLPEFAFVTFAAGLTESQQVVVTIVDDQLVEQTESFVASLSVIGNEGYSIDATDTATLTIEDNDTATFTINDLIVNESDGTAQFTVQLDHAIDREIQVAIQLTGAASDASLPEFGFVTFAAGSTEPQQVSVTIVDDQLVERTESFVASLSVIGGERHTIDATDTATLTIEDNDTATFTIDDLIVNESVGTAQFIVRLDHAIDREIQVAIQLTGAASDASLPEFAFVTFAAGSTEPQQVSVTIVDDQLVERTESFVASLSVIGGERHTIDATDTATLTIEDNDTATFTIDDLIVNESDGTAQFIVRLDHAIDREIQVAIQLTGAASDASLPEFAFVTFAAGSTEPQQVSVRIVDDQLVEQTESFVASLSVIGAEGYSIDATDTATLTIEDNDTATFTIDDLIVNESDGTAQFIVRLDHAIDREIQVAIQLTDAASDASLPEFTFVTFAAGSTESQQVVVTIVDDQLVEQTESFVASLSVIGGEGHTIAATDTATLTIEDNDTATFTINDLIVNESDGTAQFTVQLDHAIDREIQVAIQLTGAASDASLPEFTFVTFAAGSTESQQVPVMIVDDQLVEQTESFITSLSVVDGESFAIDVSNAAELNIQDNDVAIWHLRGSVEGHEGANVTYTVALVGALGDGVSTGIQLRLADASTDPADYQNFVSAVDAAVLNRDDLSFDRNTGVLTFFATREGSQMEDLIINLALVDDQIEESSEAFQIGLFSVSQDLFVPSIVSAQFSFIDTVILDPENPDATDSFASDAGLARTLAGTVNGSSIPPNLVGDASLLPVVGDLLVAFPPLVKDAILARALHEGGEAVVVTNHSAYLANSLVTLDVMAGNVESFYFQIVNPDGTLSDRIDLNIDLLEDADELLEMFKKYPNNVYRMSYRAPHAAEQPMLLLHIYEHRIVPPSILEGDIDQSLSGSTGNQANVGQEPQEQSDATNNGSSSPPAVSQDDPDPPLNLNEQKATSWLPSEAAHPLHASVLGAVILLRTPSESWKKRVRAALEGEFPRFDPSARWLRQLKSDERQR